MINMQDIFLLEFPLGSYVYGVSLWFMVEGLGPWTDLRVCWPSILLHENQHQTNQTTATGTSLKQCWATTRDKHQLQSSWQTGIILSNPTSSFASSATPTATPSNISQSPLPSTVCSSTSWPPPKSAPDTSIPPCFHSPPISNAPQSPSQPVPQIVTHSGLFVWKPVRYSDWLSISWPSKAGGKHFCCCKYRKNANRGTAASGRTAVQKYRKNANRGTVASDRTAEGNIGNSWCFMIWLWSGLSIWNCLRHRWYFVFFCSCCSFN